MGKSRLAWGWDGVRLSVMMWLALLAAVVGDRFSTTATTEITGYTGQYQFGYSVSLTDTHMAIGAVGARKVFVFDKGAGGRFPATAATFIDFSDWAYGSGHGRSVSLSATHLAIGADGVGRVYVFETGDDGRFPTTATTLIEGPGSRATDASQASTPRSRSPPPT